MNSIQQQKNENTVTYISLLITKPHTIYVTCLKRDNNLLTSIIHDELETKTFRVLSCICTKNKWKVFKEKIVSRNYEMLINLKVALWFYNVNLFHWARLIVKLFVFSPKKCFFYAVEEVEKFKRSSLKKSFSLYNKN